MEFSSTIQSNVDDIDIDTLKEGLEKLISSPKKGKKIIPLENREGERNYEIDIDENHNHH